MQKLWALVVLADRIAEFERQHFRPRAERTADQRREVREQRAELSRELSRAIELVHDVSLPLAVVAGDFKREVAALHTVCERLLYHEIECRGQMTPHAFPDEPDAALDLVEHEHSELLVQLSDAQVQLRRTALLIRAATENDTPPADDSAFVPATQIFRERFRTYKSFKRWLDSTPADTIRRQKPHPQRLLIHSGDWIRYWHKRDTAQFELLDAEPDLVADIETRKAAVRSQKQRGK